LRVSSGVQEWATRLQEGSSSSRFCRGVTGDLTRILSRTFVLLSALVGTQCPLVPHAKVATLERGNASWPVDTRQLSWLLHDRAALSHPFDDIQSYDIGRYSFSKQTAKSSIEDFQAINASTRSAATLKPYL
ncbi:hypothetical protein FOZ62_015299, partial [Perkinsus olseni]